MRRSDLERVGRQIHLKPNVGLLARLLRQGIAGHRFSLYVVSAAPEEVIHAALDGLLPAEHVIGSRFDYDPVTGEIEDIRRVTAGHGKVAVVDDLRLKLGVPRDRVIYVGDGSSDLHVMLHVNRGDGFTIAVSDTRTISEVAQRTVLCDDALGVLVPILDEIAGFEPDGIRALLEENGLVIQEWEKVRTDWLTISSHPQADVTPLASRAAG